MPLSREDQQIYAALRDATGLDHQRMQDLFVNWYPTLRPGLGIDALKQSFTEFAQARSWPQADIDRSVQSYETMARNGIPQPDSSSDAQTIKDAEELMKKDINEYFKSASLVERYGEALARRAENAEVERGTPQPKADDMNLLANVDRLMKTPEGLRDYFGSPDMQNMYRDSISRVIGEAPSEAPGPQVDSGETWTK